MKHNIFLEEPKDRVKLVVLLTLRFKYISQKPKLRFCYTAKYINSFSALFHMLLLCLRRIQQSNQGLFI